MVVQHAIPAKGTVVPVTIPSDASHFAHREELVYLPPAYYATNPPPKLPTVMMIGGEFNTPADWLRAGNAIKTIDDFAAAHHGNAPVFVFVDSGGAFNNDTECVNGPRGNSADHLTKDVVPFMVSNFGVSADRANWGVVGWSMGGTCAVDLTTMHPDMFSTFEDIAGDFAPNSGNKTQTIARLFGGNADAYASFDPATVMTRHGSIPRCFGLVRHLGQSVGPAHAAARRPESRRPDRRRECAVRAGQRQRHRLRGGGPAGQARLAVRGAGLRRALPWLAGQIETPGIPSVALPGPPVRPPGPVTIAAAGGPPGVR